MKILAIDTSTANCSASIIDENKVIADFNLNTGLTHSQTLVPMIDRMCKYSETSLNDIDVFACSIGPGSFTGLRIGIATIKGFALSLNKKVIAVPTLVGLAYNIQYLQIIITQIFARIPYVNVLVTLVSLVTMAYGILVFFAFWESSKLDENKSAIAVFMSFFTTLFVSSLFTVVIQVAKNIIAEF